MNEKYSFEDFMGQSLSGEPAKDFNNSEIIGSCFFQENAPNTHVFPDDITGVTFKNCNLDNVYIPPGNILENCTNKKIKTQNDMEDWVLDAALKPVEPLAKEIFLEYGLSIDPKDIPASWVREELVTKEEWDVSFGLSQLGDHYKELPTIDETISYPVTDKDGVIKTQQMYRIKGAADVFEKGRVPRPCLNQSVTQVAQAAAVDAVISKE